MTKIAVVGCGGIGMAHIRAYQELPDTNVAVCVDRDLEKARTAAERCGADVGSDLSNIPADVDGVSVVTPPRAHYPIVKELLNSGFNVFCEKPLTMVAKEARELNDLAKEKGKTLMVGFKMRYEPIFQKAKRLLPEIGDLVAVSSIKQQPYTARGAGDWVPNVGAMFELSVHDFDLVHWIGGLRPEKVLYAKFDHRMGWEREDAFFLTVQYGGGVTGQLQGMYARESKFFYRDLTIQFLGEKGYVRIERPDRIIVHADKFETHVIEPSNVNAFVCELGHFCRVVSGEEENSLGGEYGVMTTELIEQANRA